MRKILKLAAFLGVTSGAAGAAATPAPRPVLVRLGDMAWVAAQGGMPQVVSGQVVAPTLAACDLLALDCTVDKNTLSATVRYGARKGEQQTFMQSKGLIALAPLARFAGYEAVWDASNRLMRVNGTRPGSNWNWHDYFDNPPAGFTPYSGPLSAYQSAPQYGQSSVQQTVTAPVGLDHFVLFARPSAGQGMQMTGSLLMGSVDVPNHFSGCGGKLSCTLPAPRNALWVLALVTAK